MKKIILIVAAVAMLVGMSSCYKHSVCATYVKKEVKPSVSADRLN